VAVKPTGTSMLGITLDKTSGQNGEKVYATIKVNGAPKSGSAQPFQVEATLNGRTTIWWGLVGQ
jgi:hypothetical protein